MKNIMKFLGISREEIYRKLRELERRGFIERTFVRPVTYEASPLEFTIKTLLKIKSEELSNLTIITEELFYEFMESKRKFKSQADEPEIIYIPQHRPLFERAKQELNGAKESLVTICPWKKGIGWLSHHQKYFMNALNRKVNIRFIIENTSENRLPRLVKEFQDYSTFQLKTIKTQPHSCMGLYDRKRLILDTSVKSLFVESPCIWTNNPSVVGMAQIYFDTEWKKA